MRDSTTPLHPGQRILNTKLVEIAEHDLGRPLTPEESENYIGLCVSYATLYSCFVTTRQATLWLNALQLVSNYNQYPFCLPKRIQLSPTHKPETINNLTRITHDEIIMNYGSEELTGITYKTRYLRPRGLFDFQGRKISYFENAYGYFSSDDLRSLLSSELYGHEGVFLISGEYLPNTGREWLRHTCSIRYDAPTQHWYFYNPDTGCDLAFITVEAFIDHIHETLGHNLFLEIASWDAAIEPALFAFTQRYEDIKRNPEILNELGIHLLATQKGETLDHFFVAAQACEYTAEKIVSGLFAKNSDNETGLDYLVYYKPELLKAVMQLSRKYIALSFLLADTLVLHINTMNQSLWNRLINLSGEDRNTDLFFIEKSLLFVEGTHYIHSFIAQDTRKRLGDLFNLAIMNSHFCDIFILLLPTKNNRGETLFAFFAVYTSELLDQLMGIIFSSENPNYIQALSAAISVKSTSMNSTGLHMMARHTPDALSLFFENTENHPILHQSTQAALLSLDESGMSGWQLASQHISIPQSFSQPPRTDFFSNTTSLYRTDLVFRNPTGDLSSELLQPPNSLLSRSA